MRFFYFFILFWPVKSGEIRRTPWGGGGAEKRGAGRFRTGFVDDRDAFGSAEKKK